METRRLREATWLTLVALVGAPSWSPAAAVSRSDAPTRPVELLLARPFALSESYLHSWRADKPPVSAGYLLVVRADPGLVEPRQGLQPVLFVGAQTAEPINLGYPSGHIVALVPAGLTPSGRVDIDLGATPIFYGEPGKLPEALTAREIEAQLRQARRQGAAPPPARALDRALEGVGGALSLRDLYELRLYASELIERFSPEEEDLVRGLRVPLLRKRPGRPHPARAVSPRPLQSTAHSPERLALTGVIAAQLAGEALQSYPFFEFVRAFNEGQPIEIAVDPGLLPDLIGETAELYLVAAKSRAEWSGDPTLTDVSGGAETVTFVDGDIQDNVFLVDAGSLGGAAGVDLGVGYDLVIDLNRNGLLDGGDVIDGLGDEAGLYVVRDVTQPGPLEVTETLYSGGPWLGQDLYYPSDIASLGELPLIVVSHGGGHNYQWYDHIGYHMASYGYIVMSHENNTGPGIESASTTTLTNTDFLLGNLDTIAFGVLEGHVDSSRITWIGHSRGGEGIVRAYDRIFDGEWEPENYGLEDLRLLSSMAPTNFLGFDESNPHTVSYHVWVGGADTSTTGCAGHPNGQSFNLLDRAEQTRQSISLHGVGHADFHDGGGSSWAEGPCLVGRPDTHQIMRGYLLPLVEHHVDGSFPAEDFLWRQWERFRPIGAPTSPCVVVDLVFRQGGGQMFVIDDFESEASTTTSSSGGAVAFTVTELSEGPLDDGNDSFTDVGVGLDPMNGMIAAGPGDQSRGIVFTYDGGGPRHIEFAIVSGERDFRRFEYLSFRGCQQTRHPLTTGDLGDTTFTVTLRDGSGSESSIEIGAYGGGLEEPYQREGCGEGTGWNNEFETLRVRLTDFLHNGSGLDLSDVSAVVFRFGPGLGTPSGRLGLDQVEVGPRTEAFFADGFESGDTSAWSASVP